MIKSYLALVVLVVACKQSSTDNTPVVAKPQEASAPASVRKTEATKEPAADERDLIRTSGEGASSLDFVAPTGEIMKVEMRKRLQGTWLVELVVDGTVIDTYDSKIAKDDIHYQPRAEVRVSRGGILAVAGTTKVTGKPDDSYDARYLTWDETKKQLVISHRVKFDETYEPE